MFIAIVWGCCFTLIKQTLELIGMYFLTRPGGMSAGINLGDVLTVACAVLFAFHIVAAGHYASTGRPERLLALELALTGGLSPWPRRCSRPRASCSARPPCLQ